MTEVFIGVHSHRSTLAAAAVDGVGRILGVSEFDNDPKGHSKFVSWRAGMNGEIRIGIESSGNYGNALARALVAAGEDVFEVPANLSHREARRQGHGKSDAIDAVAIARVVAREQVLPRPRVDQTYEELKLLVGSLRSAEAAADPASQPDP
jgi:transposase